MYWRFDEGKGDKIDNLVNENLGAILENKDNNITNDLWIPLEDGDPVELEDKWGKKCPPQFAINFKSDLSLKCNKKNWFSGSINKFSLEFWLRPKSENGLILEIGQGIYLYKTKR